MKKESMAIKDLPQNTLPKLKSQPVESGPMPTGFTQGDVFFNPETAPTPFTSMPLEESPPWARTPS